MASRVPAQYAVQGHAEHGDMHLDAGWREYAKGARDYAKGAYQRASNYWRGSQRGSQPQLPPPDTQAETPPEPEMQAVEHAVDGNSARINELESELEAKVNALHETQEELRKRSKTLENILQEQGREFAQIWEAIRRN